MPRFARTIAHSMPAGPAPTTSTSLSEFVGLLEPLGMPAAPVLLAGGGVLRADDRRTAGLPARDADVAPDALADVVESTLVDLLGEERIRDRRAARRR